MMLLNLILIIAFILFICLGVFAAIFSRRDTYGAFGYPVSEYSPYVGIFISIGFGFFAVWAIINLIKMVLELVTMLQ